MFSESWVESKNNKIEKKEGKWIVKQRKKKSGRWRKYDLKI